jgi:hypothetical protein
MLKDNGFPSPATSRSQYGGQDLDDEAGRSDDENNSSTQELARDAKLEAPTYVIRAVHASALGHYGRVR